MKIYISHSTSDRDLVASLVPLLREDGHDVFVPMEKIVAGSNWISEISAAIRSAEVFVALVTSGNPNVFYELGLASGAGVPILVTALAGELLPSDLVSVPYVRLSGDTIRDAQMIARRANELTTLSLPKPTLSDSAESSLRSAAKDPAIMEALSRYDFERLIIELFKDCGYDVSDTHFARDSGVDFAIQTGKDRKLVLIEVKKLSRQSRVSVEAVRQLLAAVSAAGASLGLLIATSPYTSAAQALTVGAPIVLRTLEEILAAESVKDLLYI